MSGTLPVYLTPSDVCAEGSSSLASELKLYSHDDLKHHLEDGEIDRNDNIVLFHPRCKFCAKYFYDVKEFYHHLKTFEHEACPICKNDYPYIYYRNYETLKQHFQKSHYGCWYKECVESAFVVFAT